MHHLSQQDIDPKLRRLHQTRWKRELAMALQSPGLPDAQRALLQERLARVGQPRLYRPNDPAPPGALDPGPIQRERPPEIFDFDLSRPSLTQVSLSRLRRFAKSRNLGVDPTSTKAQVIQAIIDQPKEMQP